MEVAEQPRPRLPLRPGEWIWVGYGFVAVFAAVYLAARASTPSALPLALFCLLSALSLRLNIDAEQTGRLAASAQGMVIGAAVVFFSPSSPLLAPLLVGMAAGLWRVPRSRHQLFSVPGNFGANGLPALLAAAVFGAIGVTLRTSSLQLAAVAVPISLTYAVANVGLMALYFGLTEKLGPRTLIRELAPQLAGIYVPFVFGAFVGALSLEFGYVVIAFAAAGLVLVQAVFASYRQLVDSEAAALEGLVAAVERKDPYTAGHSLRVRQYARYMGSRLGFRGRKLAQLEQHALMHDIGKLAVPNHVLRKPGRLTAAERELMLRHEAAGAAMLAQVPFLSLGAEIARGEDRRQGMDGSARASHIVHAADAFDAMTSTRAYRKAHSQDEAFEEMRAKAGVDFHPGCVAALQAELTERAEVYGAGHEADVTVYDVPPPEVALGETLDDQAAADARTQPRRPPPVDHETLTRPTPTLSTRSWAIGASVAVASAAALVASLAPSAGVVAVPIALSALVVLGELVCLRPIGRAPRPLALAVVLVALRAVPAIGAACAIAAGELAAVAIRARDHAETREDDGRPLGAGSLAAAATAATYAVLQGIGPATSTIPVLAVLVVATVAGLAANELVTTGRIRLDRSDRLADLALVSCGPLLALATAGTATHAGFGLGAFVVMVVPLALLTHGYLRSQRAHDNCLAWIRAVSLAPEHAGLVVPGRAARVAAYARGVAARVGLDDDMRDQLEAAAWMERVGECCLDETYVTGQPHYPEEVVDASATILKSSALFSPAGQILWASLNEPELATNSDVDRAGQILRVAIAFEDATNGAIDRALVPELVARLRTSVMHPLAVELCDALQQVVAPRSFRSPWRPIRTHAVLTCGCVTPVDLYAFEGEELECAMHDRQAIEEMAVDRARHAPGRTPQLAAEVLVLLSAARSAGCSAGLQRELFVRLAPADVSVCTTLARTGYALGTSWAPSVARWLREGGASPHRTVDVLAAAGTPSWDAFEAVRSEYTQDEIDHFEHAPSSASIPG